ncbi:PaaI family thioesterase [Pseudactinotalea sp. Z1732]|uniref:PaaI family thioesterase n=1 Tax=Micrococcales TaxID=85006 RepID=UPI003C7AFE8E
MTDTDADNTIYTPEELAHTLIVRLGIELDQIGAERATGRMPVAGNTQPAGLLHGGASAALAETLASVAAHAHATAGATGGQSRSAAGVDLNITHHRAVRSGWVHGEAQALYLGGRTASYDVVITDDDGARVATARLTCQLITIR